MHYLCCQLDVDNFSLFNCTTCKNVIGNWIWGKKPLNHIPDICKSWWKLILIFKAFIVNWTNKWTEKRSSVFRVFFLGITCDHSVFLNFWPDLTVIGNNCLFTFCLSYVVHNVIYEVKISNLSSIHAFIYRFTINS